MMSLLVTNKKTKKKAVINMGKRFKGPVRQVQIEEDENQDKDVRSTRAGGGNNQISEVEDFLTSNTRRPMTNINN